MNELNLFPKLPLENEILPTKTRMLLAVFTHFSNPAKITFFSGDFNRLSYSFEKY